MRMLLALGLATLALLANPSTSMSGPLLTPSCAWRFEWTPFGPGNWFWASVANRWWYMPIDSQWQKVTLTGIYPKARFFSLAVSDNAPVSTGLADYLFDTQITPNPGSINPFADANANSPSDQTYTITVTRTDAKDGNVLRLHANTGWLLYRLNLPNAGEGSIPDFNQTVQNALAQGCGFILASRHYPRRTKSGSPAMYTESDGRLLPGGCLV